MLTAVPAHRPARAEAGTTSVSSPEADELLWRTAFGAFALRPRALASLLLALERPRMAHPKGLGLRRFSIDYSTELDYDRSYSKRVWL